MIKKLRLRFIISALLSVLFVLAATIAGINIANHLKTNREIKETLTGLVSDLDNNVRLIYRIPSSKDKDNKTDSKPDSKPDGKEGEENPGGQQGGQGQGGMGGYRQPTIKGQYFYYTYTVTKYSDREEADEPMILYDYTHVISAEEEGAQKMVVDVLNGESNEGKIDNYRYIKTVIVYNYKTTRQPWESPTWESYDVDTTTTSTYIAFVDTAEKTHGASNYLLNSLIIAGISYTLLAFMIIVSSHFIFKTSEESYRKQKAFVTNASHELKTPLTIISTDLEILEMDNGKNEWTESIRDQVGRLTVMTKQLVTLSKLDENDLKNYPFEAFSLSKLANESVDSFTPIYEQRKYKFNSDIASNLDFFGNKYLINELFYIFMDNACKYTKDKGNINLSVKRSNNRKIEIVFSNDIADKEIDTNLLFERFYRSPSSSKKEGSGIGLSIAKEIVDLHKGKISASVKDDKIYFNIIL